MRRSIARRGGPAKYARCRRVQDAKAGEFAHVLRDNGISQTPGGAHQASLRRRDAFLEVVRTFVQADDSAGLDAYLAPIDELRYAGITLELIPGAMQSIESRISTMQVSRTAWFESRDVEHARRALRDTRRALVAACEFIRILFTTHPEIRS